MLTLAAVVVLMPSGYHWNHSLTSLGSIQMQRSANVWKQYHAISKAYDTCPMLLREVMAAKPCIKQEMPIAILCWNPIVNG